MSNVVNEQLEKYRLERFANVPGAKSPYTQFVLENVANVAPIGDRSKSPSNVKLCPVVMAVVPVVARTSNPTCVTRPSTTVHNAACGVTLALS
jgi:hypothetical protein